jgi:serine protease AprX
VQRVPASVDPDSLSLGGHGTHVNGIVAGRPTTLSDGSTLQGAAPGAKLVSISTGAGIVILGADSALNWVLENHDAPCGAGVPASTCPPIKVTNNSYGPTGGGAFDPQSATVKLQRALAADGVVTVWAAGNDGGDGSTSLTNPPGQDPTGGILSVASFYDQDTGTRDGTVSDYSSRGLSSDASTWPDISAPGENITSSCRLYLAICSTGLDPRNGPGPLDIGTFNTISGTSMAAPHIAGIVAQLFQADPTATPAEIEAALKASAHKYTDGAAYVGGTSYDKGYGLVDVVAAVAALG